MRAMIRALALCLMAAPAMAQEAAFWGNDPDPAQRSSVTISLADDGAHVADILAVNRLTGGGPQDLSILVWLDGVPFRVTVLQGPGNAPDVYYAFPPEGFVAVPDHVSVDEGGDAVIMIFVLAGMPMG